MTARKEQFLVARGKTGVSWGLMGDWQVTLPYANYFFGQSVTKIYVNFMFFLWRHMQLDIFIWNLHKETSRAYNSYVLTFNCLSKCFQGLNLRITWRQTKIWNLLQILFAGRSYNYHRNRDLIIFARRIHTRWKNMKRTQKFLLLPAFHELLCSRMMSSVQNGVIWINYRPATNMMGK